MISASRIPINLCSQPSGHFTSVVFRDRMWFRLGLFLKTSINTLTMKNVAISPRRLDNWTFPPSCILLGRAISTLGCVYSLNAVVIPVLVTYSWLLIGYFSICCQLLYCLWTHQTLFVCFGLCLTPRTSLWVVTMCVVIIILKIYSENRLECLTHSSFFLP